MNKADFIFRLGTRYCPSKKWLDVGVSILSACLANLRLDLID